MKASESQPGLENEDGSRKLVHRDCYARQRKEKGEYDCLVCGQPIPNPAQIAGQGRTGKTTVLPVNECPNCGDPLDWDNPQTFVNVRPAHLRPVRS
jgi:hypothetical protein